MKIPFWNPTKKYTDLKEEIDTTIQDVLNSGNWVLGYGSYIEDFEKEFAKYTGAKYAIMVGGGTHALVAALKSAGIGPGDEVITVSHTFVASLDAISAVGGIPIAIDINRDGLMDPELIEKAITINTKAIIPVNLEGKVVDVERIQEIAKKHNLFVIYDSAQAIGSGYKGNKTGSYGDASCFSFYPAKVLGGIGCAGMVTTNSDDIAERCRMLRDHYLIGKNPDLETPIYGYNLEPDCIQAAVLSVKLRHLDEQLKRRRDIATRYNRAFEDLPLITPIDQPERVWQDYVVLVPENKEKFVEYLIDNGVGIRGHNLICNHFYKNSGLPKSLPISEWYLDKQVRIVCNPEINDEEVEYVISTVKAFYEKNTI